MITRIKIDGFKSFSDFEVELKPFNVIVGANGSGKSNLLDALKLLRDLSNYSVAEAFSKQRGTASELFTRYPDGTSAQEMKFEVDVFYVNHYDEEKRNQFRIRYSFTIAKVTIENIDKLAVTQEDIFTIPPHTDKWLDNNIPNVYKSEWLSNLYTKITHLSNEQPQNELIIQRGGNYTNEQETGIPILTYEVLPIMFGQCIKQLKFLDLDPKKLREPSPVRGNDILKENGQNLPAVLHRMAVNDTRVLKHIAITLNYVLSTHKDIRIKHNKDENKYYIELKSKKDIWFNARLLSEGTLRVLAFLVLKFDEEHQGPLCVEEPENGVHHTRIKAILETLLDISSDFSREPFEKEMLKQVFITSHSPVLLSKALKLKGNIGLFHAQIVSAVNYIPGYILDITQVYPIQKEENSSKITLNIGDRHIYAKQVIDYLESTKNPED
jgi:predicted ATPase